MSTVVLRKVEAADADMRLDRWFKRHYPDLGHGRLEKLLRTGQVRVNGGRVKAADRLATGDEIRVPPLGEAPKPTAPKADGPPPLTGKLAEIAASLKKAIIHRDDRVIVINKPPGLAVQGGSGLNDAHLDAALDALRFGAAERPKLVHRLDKDTSGVLVLARDRLAASALTKAFRARDAAKTYWALVAGVPRPARGRINLALAKEGPAGHEKMRAVTHPEDDDDAKRAVTYYAVVEQAGGRVGWLAMRPLTGRTHQLRAHAAFLGTPIVGDGKYGGAEAFLTGGVSRKLHLHARAIDIAHPDGGRLTVTAELPHHMVESFKLLGFDATAGADVFAELDE
ncbi:RluA family pseudouridine synthase [Zavarzinia compransoris]|uniref:Pseudouridine synthase n=1 Tax=Zavarzinia compransoris TaxID=1264899 RepID=A0A317DVL5_9PROT|nr:RluA family pseudouridine synthase [Zavarzinia compransoris]PWR18010.1 RluA family pseudouridine synthase [Zavarzinia compransoris]TDP43525.1 ribosomal large subunit pseudouridine synthase C [Zavarzinia compransoris]